MSAPPEPSTTSRGNTSFEAGADLEKAPIDKVLSELSVNADQGLSEAEITQRLARYGPNALVEKEISAWRKILGHFTGPIAYMIEAAAIISAIIGHWDDFAIIAGLLFFNAALEFWQDRKASNALAALKKGLAPEATVLRDGKWQTVAAATLVPGDIVKIRLGVIVPADLRLVGGDYASIDQAALTGESLPVAKKIGDLAYSGSVVKQGEMLGVVIATGANTFFGRTAKLVAGAGAVSHAQKAMFEIGNFLIVVAVVLAVIMIAVRVYHDIVISDDWDLSDALGILQFVLVLLVASIPVAMPAVFSITMALGALALSKQKAIVSKLSAIEEMAGVDILCSDKTGTLTKNKLTLGEPILLVGEQRPRLHRGRGAGFKNRGPRRHRHRGDRRPDGSQCAHGLQTGKVRPVRSGQQAHRGDRYGSATGKRSSSPRGHRRSLSILPSQPPTSPKGSRRPSMTSPRKGRARSALPAPTMAGTAGRCSAYCRCSIRRATIPSRRSS